MGNLSGKKGEVHLSAQPIAHPGDPSADPTAPVGTLEDCHKAGKMRFVCVSDTHNLADKLEMPPGDVLLHAGDWSNTGVLDDVKQFNDWLGTLSYKYKIVIAGNHDLPFDPEGYEKRWSRFHKVKQDPKACKAALTNCIYLEDEEYVIENRVKVYGSPWQPEFCDWAFNLPRGAPLKKYWDKIPADTNVLLTHGPPWGNHGGVTYSGFDAGCEELLLAIQRIKPQVHVYGHIHEGAGTTWEGPVSGLNTFGIKEGPIPTKLPDQMHQCIQLHIAVPA